MKVPLGAAYAGVCGPFCHGQVSGNTDKDGKWQHQPCTVCGKVAWPYKTKLVA